MIEEKRKAIDDIIDYSAAEIDEMQLEQQLEAAPAKKMDDLDSLRDDLRHIDLVDHLGDVILSAAWDQFVTQIPCNLGEEFLRENGGLTLDLSDDAHIQSTEMFAEGIFATHYTGDIDFHQRYVDWQYNFQRDDAGNIICHTTRGGKSEPTRVKDARKPYDAARPKTPPLSELLSHGDVKSRLPHTRQAAVNNSDRMVFE